MEASMASFICDHGSLFCAFLLLLLVLPSPSYMQTLTLTNPHILHIPSELSLDSASASLPQHGTTLHVADLADQASTSPSSISGQQTSPLLPVGDKSLLFEHGLMPTSATPFIYEKVAASYNDIPAHPHETAPLDNNAPQEDHFIQLSGDGELHADAQSSVSIARSYIYEKAAAASIGLLPQSLLYGKGTRVDDGYLVHDGVESSEARAIELEKHLVSRLDETDDVVNEESSVRDHDSAARQRGASSVHAFLVDDGVTGEDSGIESPAPHKETNLQLQDNVAQGEFSYLLNDGSDSNGIYPDGARQQDVIGGSTMDQLQRLQSDGGQVQRVDGDTMMQRRSETNGELRTAVGDRPAATSWRRDGSRRRGRSPTCTPKPNVCAQQLGDREKHRSLISGYGAGLHEPVEPSPKQPACCGGVCVDLNSDISNCGSCGRQCIVTQGCCAGSCVDLNRDMANCGGCGNVCPPLSPCQFGICGYY